MRDLPLARAYRQQGFGTGGVLLKQSLYPGELFVRLLEGARLVLDFGCGEGLLTNLLARRLPGTRFIGIDLDAKKIAAGQACRSTERVEFRAGSFLEHAEPRGADAVIFNDVLHHLPAETQLAALRLAAECLTPDGIIILKEVDPADRLDVRHTTFWDHRLYPADQLAFSSPRVWEDRLLALGFRKLGGTVVRHPWIASRTMFWFTRRPKLAEFAPPLPLPAAPAGERVLVTGATGFIGEWVLRELLARGLDGRPVQADVVARDARRLSADLATHPGVRVLAGDLTDAAFTASLAGPYAAVFHLAATVDYFGGRQVYENNLTATVRLLEVCERLQPARLVFTSTMGALDRGRWDFARHPLDERSPGHPTSPYGRAKWDEERRVRAAAIDWTIVRVPWCYGPGMAESHHVRNLLNRARRGSAACRVNWPGRVSVVEVREAARWIVAAATSPRTARETFFLADEDPVSMGQLFAEMGRTVGAPTAATWRLPGWMWSLIRLGLPLAPFQLKCLLSDALVVSTQHARELGINVAPRATDWLLPLARYNSAQLHPSRHLATALITGAAGGIGACLARQHHARGYALVLADRNEQAVLARCREWSAQPWVVDLSDRDLPAVLSATFPQQLPWPALVINNAGVGWRGLAWQAGAADNARVLGVNAAAPVAICEFFLRECPTPVVLANVSSTSAFQPLPYMAAYAAAKSFILSYSLALHAETVRRGRGDHVLTIVPSGTQTGFQAAAGVKTNAKEKLLSPDEVAGCIAEAIARRRALVLVGGRARIMRWMSLVLPLRRQPLVWEKLMRGMR
jgi:nucleoside-diphosphate-sugar epimerase/SAM-dependent methyltransferase